jgi:5-methyltetrahydrofolate--homocysteine methyltransferase
MMFGMDSAIMDPLNRDLLGGVYAAEALLGKDEYCIEYLSAYRDDLFGGVK